MTKLSVNVNKIATLRNARGGDVPNLVQFSKDIQRFGADGITVHPRPDERHIRYSDVLDLKKVITTEFNIEGYPTPKFIDLVLRVKPHQVTLVPDPPDVLTSNSGWNTKENESFLKEVISEFKNSNIRTSIFIETDKKMIEGAAKIGTDRIELYTESGQGNPIIILHGLFGSLDNWQTLANRFSSDFQVFTLDLRNHGKSEHSSTHSYKSMTEDIKEFILDHDLENIILIGHSMGGKTAMLFANTYPEFLEKLVVVDIGVKGYPPHHTEILKGLNAIPQGEFDSRSAADEILIKHVADFSTRLFLLKNLTRDQNKKLIWKMNLPVLENTLLDICSEIKIDPIYLPTLFIRGENSNYILEEDFDSLEEKFPYMEMITAENAGHWVHAEAPELFYESVLAFI